MVNFEFQYDTLLARFFRIKDEIYKSFSGFVFPFYSIFIPCSQINQIYHCG